MDVEDGAEFLANLPERISYRGEFGAELVLFLPFVTWLSRAGLLKDRVVETYRGMRCFYEDLRFRDYVEVDEPRRAVPPQKRLGLPVASEHHYGRAGPHPFLAYPDLRARFGALSLPDGLLPDGRKLLVIHNKYVRQWHGRIVNFIDLDSLRALIERLRDDYCIVYIRHGIRGYAETYSKDREEPGEFGDLAVIRAFPDVLLFDDLFEANIAAGGSADLNTFKNTLYSRCHHFITVQGGGAHHISLFKGSLMAIYHVAGEEERFAYSVGYYGFAANPSPTRAICYTVDDLMRATTLFKGSRVYGDRALVGAADEATLARLSPFRKRPVRQPPWVTLAPRAISDPKDRSGR